MSKRFQSYVVILVTILCALIMIFSDQINDRTNLIKDKILVMSKRKINSEMESSDVIKKDEDTNKKIEVHKDSNVNRNVAASAFTSEKYKKFKMEKVNQELAQDKEDFFCESNNKEDLSKRSNSVQIKKGSVNESKNDISAKQSNQVVNSKSDTSKEDVPVFKVSRSQINDSLTLADKTKLLSIASKLSAVDYEKVREYLQNGSDQDIKNIVKLLKERLSEKDYDKAKEVAQKIINMDVAEQ